MAGYIGSKAVSLSTTAANVEGNITVTGNVDGRDVSVDGTKLDTIPIISTSSVPSFTAKSDGTTDGYIQLNCSANSHGIKLKSPPHSAGASYTLVFPVNDGDSGQFLRTDGSGVLSWGTDATLDNTKLPLAGGAMTGAITTNSTFDGVDVGARDAVLTDTTTKATAALPKTGGAMTGAITTNSTFDGVDIATRNAVLTTTTNTANAALPKAGGAMTGAITTNSTFDGRDVAADGVLATNALPKSGGAVTGNVTFGDNNKAIFGAELEIYTDGTQSFIKESGSGDLLIYGNNLRLGNADGSELYILGNNNAEVQLRYNNATKLATTATGVSVTGQVLGTSTTHAGGTTFDSTGTTQLWLRDTNAASNQKNWGFQISGGDLNIVRANDDRASGFVTPIYIQQAPANSLVINSSGTVGIGTTNANVVGNNVAGINLLSDGMVGISRAGIPLKINRTAEGGIIELYEAGTPRGQIDISSDRVLIRSSGDATGLRFDGVSLTPFKNGSAANGTVDLGFSSGTFRDLYLSGGVRFDTNGEFLNDYEVGTWTASPTTGSCTSNVWYTKVGRLVTVAGNIYSFSNRSSSATVIIGTLPYAVSSGKSSVGAIIGRYIDNPGYSVYTDGGGTTLTFYNNPSDAAYDTMKHNDFNNSGVDIHFAVTYLAAS